MPAVAVHNGGNDAVYELRSYLAELALTREQHADLPLPLLEETVPPPPPKGVQSNKVSSSINLQSGPAPVVTDRQEPSSIPYYWH